MKRIWPLFLLFLCTSAHALPKAQIGFGATSMDLMNVGSWQIGQGGMFVRFNQINFQMDYGLTFANVAGSTSSVFGANFFWAEAMDEQKSIKYGPGAWWASFNGNTVFSVSGQIGLEYNPDPKFGIEGILIPVRIGFGPGANVLQFLSARVGMTIYQ